MPYKNGVLKQSGQMLAARGAGSRRLRHLLSPEQVKHLLERERARSDRSGLGFCLAVFGASSHGAGHVLPRIAKAAMQRARLTDEVGWLDDDHVCVLLPDTAAGGARALARDVAQAVSKAHIQADVRIYGYDVDLPADLFLRRQDDQDQHRGDSNDKNDSNGNGSDGHGGQRSGGHRSGGHRSGGHRSGDRRHAAPAHNGNGNDRPGRAVATRGRRIPIPGGFLVPAESASTTDTQTTLAQPTLRPLSALSDLENDEFPQSQPHVAPLEDVDTLLARPLPPWKRTLDILGASLAILLFSPIMLIAALAVKFTSRGPVIFRQPRAGLAGRPFTMYKFRSMVVGAEAQQAQLRAANLNEQDGPAFKLKNDPRVTKVGKFLRKTSLDELPQLFNVLRGEMTLVGPRPLPISESDQCHRWHRRRLDVTPGITCVWQVEGRSEVYFDEWMRMDLQYVRRRSLLTDLTLILRTIPAVLLRRGAR